MIDYNATNRASAAWLVPQSNTTAGRGFKTRNKKLTRKAVDEESEELGEVNFDLSDSGHVVLQVDAVGFEVQPGSVDVLREGLRMGLQHLKSELLLPN